jgi:acetylornithine deacetylase/succinyl-diaminopimelate desuccinylase-like protein
MERTAFNPVRGMSDDSSRLLRASRGRTAPGLAELPVEVHGVPGHHATMVAGKYAAGMAARLRAVINDTLSY